MDAPLVNRIAKSKLITIDPGRYYPAGIERFDLKEFLFQGLILREKEFRQALDDFDWKSWNDKIVHLFCSVDAIIPMWAYMLVASKGSLYARHMYTGGWDEVLMAEIMKAVESEYPPSAVEGGKFVIKGCGDRELPPGVYSRITGYLISGGAKTVMYGEPCSTVPIYRKKK